MNINATLLVQIIAFGALIWFTAFWSNSKLQTGPHSDPVSINIPGGGVSMAA